MFRFTLFDYTNSDGSIPVVLKKEPIGFDGTELRLSRHKIYKGINFEHALQQIEIDDIKGYKIITDAYNYKGVNANVTLLIEYQCDECNECMEELAHMKLMYQVYEDSNGEYCSVKIGLQPLGCIMDWKTNEENKVNLESLTAYDGITTLQPYNKLPFVCNIPGKTIQLRNEAKATTKIYDDISADVDFNIFDESTGIISGLIMIPLDLNPFYEFGDFATLPTADYIAGNSSELTDSDCFYTHGNTAAIECAGDVNIDINISCRVIFQSYASYTRGGNFVLTKIDKDGNIITPPLYTVSEISSTTVGITTTVEYEMIHNADYTLNDGDKLYLYVVVQLNKTTTGEIGINFETDKDSYLKMRQNSVCVPTPAKLFMINESFSRIVESITNSCMRVYSDYFGRTDAQPYTSESDGCGSLMALTSGLFIRGVDQVKSETTQPVFSLSFKELFQSMDAIHCIGVDIEVDPSRAGYNRLRIENIEHFYQDVEILSLGEIYTQVKVKQAEIYNTFKFGYDKWEAEEYNGLDEFLTKREYKTDLQCKNILEKICQFIASGYAIEITRRKGNDTSKDWRYDNDTFIICMKRGEDGGIIVEQGHITGAENIIDPDTILNYRISPVRNAMRWIRDIFKGFKDQNLAKTDFTSGDGNYYAKGMYTGACSVEAEVIQENVTITKEIFANPDKASPIEYSEAVVVQDIPISYEQYKIIRKLPYGYVSFYIKGVKYKAWLEDFKYQIVAGTGSFILIPKR